MHHNIVLVSAAQQCESAVSVHIYLPSEPSSHHPVSSLQVSTGHWGQPPCLYGSLPPAICLTRGSVYMSALFSKLIPPSPSLLYPHIHSLCLCLYSCPADRFISTVFLDSIYMHIYTVFAFFFLTNFTLLWTDSRFILLTTNDPVLFLFYGWVIFLCIYVPQLLLLFFFFGTTTSFFSPFIFISWGLITLQYCSGFCHTLTWISHGFTCVPIPEPPSHFPPHPIPLDLPSAPALSTCLVHPAWAGDLFHPW